MHQLLETTVNQLQLQQIEYKDLLVEKVPFMSSRNDYYEVFLTCGAAHGIGMCSLLTLLAL